MSEMKKNNGAKRILNGDGHSSPSADRRRPVLSVTVPAALKRRVEREAQRRGTGGMSATVEALLEEALCASDEGRRGDVTAAQLGRLGMQLATLTAELRARDALIVELLTTQMKTFLAHTPPPAEDAREEARRSAAERFERLVGGVRGRLSSGDAALARLLEVVPVPAGEDELR